MRKRTFWFAIILCFLSLGTMAQPPDDPNDDADVPISGIEWLLLAGGLLGSRRIYKKYKKNL